MKEVDLRDGVSHCDCEVVISRSLVGMFLIKHLKFTIQNLRAPHQRLVTVVPVYGDIQLIVTLVDAEIWN